MNNKNAGFTLIEVILSIAVFAILVGFIFINVIRPQTQSSVIATTNTLVTELRQQQIKAMVGDTEGANSAQSFGIFFEPNAYVLFKGTSYNPNDTTNFRIPLESNLSLSTTFVNSAVIFSQRTGEPRNYLSGQNTILVRNTAGGEQKTIRVNRYGVADVL